MRDHSGGTVRVRRAALALVSGTVLLAGPALLAGCAEKQEANATLPSASEAPATSAPALPPMGPAEFPVPLEARTKDAAGAEAFLRYYIELINRQQTIPAGQPLCDLGPDCQECLRIARNYDEAAAAGHRYVGGGLTLNDVPPPVMDRDNAEMSFGVRAEAVQLIDAAGADVEPGLPVAPNLGSGIDLVWSSTQQTWLVTAFNIG